MKTDTQLRRDVQAELNWDPRFDARDIGIMVKDGVVTLTGHSSIESKAPPTATAVNVKSKIEEAFAGMRSSTPTRSKSA